MLLRLLQLPLSIHQALLQLSIVLDQRVCLHACGGLPGHQLTVCNLEGTPQGKPVN